MNRFKIRLRKIIQFKTETYYMENVTLIFNCKKYYYFFFEWDKKLNILGEKFSF